MLLIKSPGIDVQDQSLIQNIVKNEVKENQNNLIIQITEDKDVNSP